MSSTLSAVLLLCVVSCVYAGNVLNLTPKSFDRHVDGSKFVMVEFYAPWCGHCQELEPEYERLADFFRTRNNEIVIAKVDADLYRNLGERFEVSGFPTIKWFPKGMGPKSNKDYTGSRNYGSLRQFIDMEISLASSHKAQSAVSDLTGRNFDYVVDGRKNVVVEFFAPWCSHCRQLEPHWEKVGIAYQSNFENLVVAKLDGEAHREIASRFNVQAYPTIMFFPKGETHPSETYSGHRNKVAILEWLQKLTGLKPSSGGLTAELNSKHKRTSAVDDGSSGDESVAGGEELDYDAIIDAQFVLADTDKNGLLDREEAEAMLDILDTSAAKRSKEIATMFREMDVNKDGQISRFEFKHVGK